MRNRSLTVAIIAGLCASAVLALVSLESGESANPGTNGRIVFTGQKLGGDEIFSADPDGANEDQLTFSDGFDDGAQWSPDGTKIAFASSKSGNAEIYVMDTDGNNQANISQNADHDSSPEWSPDGSKIAFVSTRAGNFEIYVMETDGDNPVRLTNDLGLDASPAWSPDGSQIAFFTDREGDDEIYVMDANGDNEMPLTATGDNDDPDWHPDGDLIAFVSRRDGNRDVYTMQPDGSDPQRITDSPRSEIQPAWSPDGSQIVVSYSDDDGTAFNLYVMDANGDNRERITEYEDDEYNPDWQPTFPTPIPTATPTASPTPTPTASPTPSPTAGPELVQGDNDCDGDSDAVDALKGLQHIAAIPFEQGPDCPDIGAALPAAAPAGEPPEIFGDVDCDGDVDAVDALKILQFVAAIPFTQDEPCVDVGEAL